MSARYFVVASKVSDLCFKKQHCLARIAINKIKYIFYNHLLLRFGWGLLNYCIPVEGCLLPCNPKSYFCCREGKNLVFCFGAQFNSTLNFTQSGWLILFSPDLHFWLAKWVSGQTQALRRETVTRTDVPLVVPA